MKPADQLDDFVGKALAMGRGREEISEALRNAGWLDSEVNRAMGAWAEGDFAPPVPRPRNYVSASDAFIYAILFTALCFSIFHINSLGFALVDIWFAADEFESYRRQWTTSSLRWSIAILVIAMPLFLWLNRGQTRQLKAEPAKRRSALRKWFGYVTLFLAAFGFAGNLVASIYALLNGDFTLQFALKAGLVLVTAVLVLLYYRQDMEHSDAP